MELAAASASASPITHTLSPMVTGGSVIGIRYKDGVMVIADVLGSYGSLARFTNLRRIIEANPNTLVGASGEFSDFQFIQKLLDDLKVEDFSHDDGHVRSAKEIHNFLSRVLYNRRSRVNPLWNQLVTAGKSDGKFFLGYVDMYGSNYSDDIVATGYGTYLAVPLLRAAHRPDMDEKEARNLLEKAATVVFYRDCRALNKFTLGTVTDAGVQISEPYSLPTEWDFKRFVDPSSQS